ncbi:MAG: pyridoxal phosphate-dependent aminotransferase [Vulcanimicrobiaceae bacterium]
MTTQRSARLRDMPGIGVDRLGDLADTLSDPDVLRLENLDTDLRPYGPALEMTRRAVGEDAANSYLPFLGQDRLRKSATAHVAALSGVDYDWRRSCIVTAGGLSGILNVLLAVLDQGDEVVLTDPVYVGLLNRVRLAGGIPRLVPLIPTPDGWRLDLDAFRAATASPRVRAVVTMSPSMPTGATLTSAEWAVVAQACAERDLLLVHDAAMERIAFDGRAVIHPASLPAMAERTVTVGSASKELRMIGWRIGWVVGPPPLVADVGLVSISNVVCQVGIAMEAAAVALEAPPTDVADAVAEWERRRDLIVAELDGIVPAVNPHGGWSLLIDVGALGFASDDASRRLLERGRIAATPMVNWGSATADRYVRFVFSNEPCNRLAGIGARVRAALLTGPS